MIVITSLLFFFVPCKTIWRKKFISSVINVCSGKSEILKPNKSLGALIFLCFFFKSEGVPKIFDIYWNKPGRFQFYLPIIGLHINRNWIAQHALPVILKQCFIRTSFIKCFTYPATSTIIFKTYCKLPFHV